MMEMTVQSDGAILTAQHPAIPNKNNDATTLFEKLRMSSTRAGMGKALGYVIPSATWYTREGIIHEVWSMILGIHSTVPEARRSRAASSPS